MSVGEQLFNAAEKGSETTVRELLKRATLNDVRWRNELGHRALLQASRKNRTKIVQMLLAHPGIEVNAQDVYGNTALALASYLGYTKVVELLLSCPGIAVNLLDQTETSALMNASNFGHAEIVEMLLAVEGVKVNWQDSLGTALIKASSRGHPKVVERLLAYPGIEVNLQNKDGASALMRASFEGHSKIVEMLFSFPGVDVNLRDWRGKTALDVAKTSKIKSILSGQGKPPSAPGNGFLGTIGAMFGMNQPQNVIKTPIVDNSSSKTKFPRGNPRFKSPAIEDAVVPANTEETKAKAEESATTASDRAALDAFLQSNISDVLLSAGHINEIHLKLCAHERALHLLVNKQKECPSLFWFYPKKRELRNWLRDPLKCLLQDSLMMVVVCPVTLRVVKCGPDGLGWEISSPKAWVKKWGPAILFSIYVMQAAVIAGRVVGIPLPQLPSAGDVANTLGLKCDALAAGMTDMLNQERLMESLSAFTSTTEHVLGETDAPMQALCAKMHLQQEQQKKQQKAMKKGAPFPPVRAEITLDTDMPTQMFEESYKSIHTFLTTGENALLGKLEDQLRGSMERVLADDGDVEWVSVEAVEVWKQQHQLMKQSSATPAPDQGGVNHRPSTQPLSSNILASSWLAVRLRQKGIREELIAECEQKLVVDEDHSEEHLMAAMSSEHFTVEYLREVGIKAGGLQQKLLALHRELVAQYHPPVVTPVLDSPSTPNTSFASAEMQAALEKKLEELTNQLSKLEASSSGKGGDSPVPGPGNSGGGKGGLQQVLKQRTDTATASINPRTGQQYTVDELVLEIQLMKNDMGYMATHLELTRENRG